MRPLRAAALRIGRPGLAAGAPARLDHPGGVAAVLGATLALRAGHCGSGLSRSSMLARLRIGTRSGQPSKAACGARPTSSASRDRRVALDGLEQRAPAAAPRGPRRCRRPARRRRARRASARSRAGPAAPPRRPRGWRRRSAARRLRSPSAPSSRLKATSGGRAATSTAPAVGCRCARAEVGRQPARPCAARAPARRRGAARRACARRPARRRGRRAGRARRARRRARAPRRARRRAARPCEVDDRRDVDRADVRVQPGVARDVDALDRLARRRPRAPACSVPGSPASVNTARWWSGSAWRSSRRAPPAAKAAPMRVERRGVAALGDVGDGEQHAQST